MVHMISAGYANTFLIQGDAAFMAVDVGTVLAAEMVEHHIKETAKHSDTLPVVITATHFHIDHVGGIAELKKRCPSAKVLFSETARKYIEKEKPLAVPPLHRWIFNLIPVVAAIGNQRRNLMQGLKSGKEGIPLPLLRSIQSSGYECSCSLSEGTAISGFPGWRVLRTPGHTPESISLYNKEEKVLISGDTILNMDGTGEVNSFCCSLPEIRHSFEKIEALQISQLCPGHGKVLNGSNLMSNVRRL